MIAPVLLVVLIAQAVPSTPPPMPLRENLAPVTQTHAPAALAQSADIDRLFAVAAMQGNAAEMQMAQLAVRRGSAPDVKAFAQKMLTEHAGLADDLEPELMRVAGAAPAERLAAPDALALAHLRSLSDVDFDQAYAAQQVGDHLATLTAFRTEADNGTDSKLKSLARKWLPTIEAHLQLAVSLTGHIGGASPFKAH